MAKTPIKTPLGYNLFIDKGRDKILTIMFNAIWAVMNTDDYKKARKNGEITDEDIDPNCSWKAGNKSLSQGESI